MISRWSLGLTCCTLQLGIDPTVHVAQLVLTQSETLRTTQVARRMRGSKGYTTRQSSSSSLSCPCTLPHLQITICTLCTQLHSNIVLSAHWRTECRSLMDETRKCSPSNLHLMHTQENWSLWSWLFERRIGFFKGWTELIDHSDCPRYFTTDGKLWSSTTIWSSHGRATRWAETSADPSPLRRSNSCGRVGKEHWNVKSTLCVLRVFPLSLPPSVIVTQQEGCYGHGSWLRWVL